MVASSWVADEDTSAAKLLSSTCQSLSDVRRLVETTQRESRL